jgi:hypothetical protein
MYSTRDMNMPRKPVILSQASADAEVSAWMQGKAKKVLQDIDGLDWMIDARAQPKPTQDSRAPVWCLTVKVSAQVSAETIEEALAYDAGDAERFISLMDELSIPLEMKPVTYHFESLEDAREFFADQHRDIQTKLSNAKMTDIKRLLVGRWIEERCNFGSKVL